MMKTLASANCVAKYFAVANMQGDMRGIFMIKSIPVTYVTKSLINYQTLEAISGFTLAKNCILAKFVVKNCLI